MDKFKPVLVKWEDATSIDGWTTLDDIKDTEVTCQTVGMLIEETPNTISIVLSHAPTGSRELYGQAIVIPRRAIVEMYQLEVIGPNLIAGKRVECGECGTAPSKPEEFDPGYECWKMGMNTKRP
jgi:hypothetical protein